MCRPIQRACFILAGLSLLGIPFGVKGQNLLTNSSFETPNIETSGLPYSTDSASYFNPFVVPPDWQSINTVNINEPFTPAFPFGVPDGTQTATIDPGATLYQDTSVQIIAGVTYTLSAYVGNRADYGGSGSFSLRTMAGDILVQSGEIIAPTGIFQQVTLSYTPTATDPYLMQTLSVYLSGESGNQVHFDEVVLTRDPPLPGATITGTLTLEGIAPDAAAQDITFVFRPSDNSGDITRVASVSRYGEFTILDLPNNNYILHIKGSKYLAANVNVDASSGNVANVNAMLSAGDSDGNNLVDIGDFGILVGAYGSFASDPTSGYDVQADLNGDNTVDLGDFGLLVNNYGLSGDP